MRWRLADRVESFEPWREIRGRKAVSLEEYELLAPLGREGACPESLVLESCVEFARWLVAASSNFEKTCVLEAVGDFRFLEEAGMGDSLAVAVAAAGERGKVSGPLAVKAPDTFSLFALQCRVERQGRPVAAGGIVVGLLPLAEGYDREAVECLWRELHGAP